MSQDAANEPLGVEHGNLYNLARKGSPEVGCCLHRESREPDGSAHMSVTLPCTLEKDQVVGNHLDLPDAHG